MTSRKLLLLVLLVAAVFVGLAGYGDFKEVAGRLSTFPFSFLSVALALAALNYFLRFLRWLYYLELLKITIPLRLSLLIFFSGLALSITPGKVGEVIKGYFLRNRAGVPLSTSLPAIFMERLTDVIAVVLISLVGLALLPEMVRWVLLGIFLLCGGLVWFLASQHTPILFRMPLLRRWRDDVELSQDGLRLLTTPRSILVSVGLGTVAWFCEGLALWVIVRGLGVDLSILWAIPIYSAATIVGALSTLPGGLLGAEGTMLALFQQGDIPRDVAAAATLLVRLVTLWFAVALGLLALATLNRLEFAGAEKE